jgi:hypothetical protein
MKTILFIIALVLILIWTIGFIGYRIGGVFDGILILAFILEATGVIWELRHTKLNGSQANEAQINQNQVK